MIRQKPLSSVAAPVRRQQLQELSALLRRWFDSVVIYWLVPVGILIAWHLVVSAGLVEQRNLPHPLKVLRTAFDMVVSGGFLYDVAVSALRAFGGLLIGGTVGFVLGLINGTFRTGEKLLDTTIQMIRTVPVLALMPLIILWMGIGESTRLFLISMGVFFPIYLNTFHGIRNVDRGLIEMAQNYGLSMRQLFWQIILPGALPSILVGLRFALGIMWLTLIAAEMLAANAGIGYMTTQAREFILVDRMIFAVVLYALLGKLADVLTRLLESTLLRWHPNYQRQAKAAPRA
jgi:sulfonate transport system permease protein